MEPAFIVSLITVATPIITSVIKKNIPITWKTEFKKVIPIVPPLVGAALGFIGSKTGIVITPDISNAVAGLFIGAMGSTGYDAVKAQK
jgi:hypothetical protein